MYCARLAHDAVHAAMSGRTKMVIGVVNNHFVHIPISLVAAGRQFVDPDGDLWDSVLEVTGQPRKIG